MPEAKVMPGLAPHVADVSGRETHYWVGGEGPPVVLIHGLGGAATNWTELAPLLARRHRVVVPDLPGHGRSAPLEEVRGLTSYANHVGLLAEQLDALPAAVVGHSLGGVVSLRLAEARPEDVRALALVCAAGIHRYARWAERALRITSLFRPDAAVARRRFEVARRARLRRAVFGHWGAVDAAALSERSVLGLLGPRAHATDVASARRALFQDDPRPDLHRVTCPTLLVWGARDRLVPLASGFEYARRLRAPIRTLAAAGHLVIVERADECAAILEQFFAGLDGVREVDELPLEAELLREPGTQGADA
jgi:pimeloyl-ACP methyl ester carboxylesterase